MIGYRYVIVTDGRSFAVNRYFLLFGLRLDLTRMDPTGYKWKSASNLARYGWLDEEDAQRLLRRFIPDVVWDEQMQRP